MSHPNPRLPQHVLKAVLGRLLVYKALDLYRAELAAADYDLLWDELRGTLRTSTERQLRFIRDDQSLQDYLRELAGELRGGLHFPDAAAERECAPLLDFMDKLMSEAAQTQNDLLADAFDRAVQLASNKYISHGLPVPPELIERTTIRFDHRENMLGQILPIQMTAYTLLDEDSPPLSAAVHMILAPRLLDEQTAFAFPYVLLHECLCHVLQGPWVWPRLQADADSRFAEGWMDVAAYRLHAGLDNAVADTDLLCPLRRAAQMQAADAVHAARRARQDADRAWSYRALGADAADRMLYCLGHLPESQTDPDIPFMHLSLSLNASSVGNNERDLFVSRVYHHLDRMSRPDFVGLVREYLRDRDALRLVDRTARLVV